MNVCFWRGSGIGVVAHLLVGWLVCRRLTDGLDGCMGGHVVLIGSRFLEATHTHIYKSAVCSFVDKKIRWTIPSLFPRAISKFYCLPLLHGYDIPTQRLLRFSFFFFVSLANKAEYLFLVEFLKHRKKDEIQTTLYGQLQLQASAIQSSPSWSASLSSASGFLMCLLLSFVLLNVYSSSPSFSSSSSSASTECHNMFSELHCC